MNYSTTTFKSGILPDKHQYRLHQGVRRAGGVAPGPALRPPEAAGPPHHEPPPRTSALALRRQACRGGGS